MEVFTANSVRSLWLGVMLILSDEVCIPKFGKLIRANGVFDLTDKSLLLNALSKQGIVVSQCDIYRSAVDEENRMEIRIINFPISQ